jgi:hypothetical protein
MSTEPVIPQEPQPAQEAPAVTQAPAASPTPATTPPAPQQSFDPRRRLRELLSIPERDRTDPQWDEINELEIQLAPGNRIGAGHSPGSSDNKPAGGRQFQQKKHPPKGGGKRRPRPGNNPNKPQSQ